MHSQTRPSTLKLTDPTKPGFQRYISIYLVEPSTDILSTANIPPQQMNWYNDALLGTTPAARKEALSKLPPELVLLITENEEDIAYASAGCRLPAELMEMVYESFKEGKRELQMTFEEANEHRAKLLKERDKFHRKIDRDWRNKCYCCVID